MLYISLNFIPEKSISKMISNFKKYIKIYCCYLLKINDIKKMYIHVDAILHIFTSIHLITQCVIKCMEVKIISHTDFVI